MSNEVTKRMLAVYEQFATPVRFLTGYFLSPPKNFHNSEKVEYDVVRGGRKVSVVVQDLSAGNRDNELSVYTNKSIAPPIYDEEAPINAFDLINRVAGKNPFEDVNFQINATEKALKALGQCSDKIKRAIEVQASQIMQTAVLNLKDKGGNIVYTLDYKGKTTHFPTAPILWNSASAVPLQDMEVLADQIRDDGLMEVDTAVFGQTAWSEFLGNTGIKQILDNRRINLGQIEAPTVRGNGGKYHGTIAIGSYKVDLWTYNGVYEDVQTGAITPYVGKDKVIMFSSTASQFDATYGSIPTFNTPFTGVLPALPNRLSSPKLGTDIFTRAWVTDNGRQLMVSAASRPLLIPTGIDTFGCLAT